MTYKFRSKVWVWPGQGGWHFVSLPNKLAVEIKTGFNAMTRGWGSLPVKVEVGTSQWQTSIFPDSKTGTYVLPLKADVRKKEKIKEGSNIKLTINIIL